MRHRHPFPNASTLTLVAGLLTALTPAGASDSHGSAHATAPSSPPVAAKTPASAATAPESTATSDKKPNDLGERIRAAVADYRSGRVKQVSLTVNADDAPTAAGRRQQVAAAAPGTHTNPTADASREYIRAKAATLAGHESHWEYEGDGGPERWGQLKPEFNACAIGKRQSPIHIQSTEAVPGPAEPIEFHYGASGGAVINNGHTIQVDPLGHNWIKVRGSAYKLVQFHFHHPAEEKINYKGFAMVAHLVHKNEAGQLAVVAVLMDVGPNNPFLQKVWTHMPLDTNDRVPLPDELIDLSELLPQDQRYYQFMGSLTTPPCTEGVLWLVLKQPVTLGPDQLKLFTALFPMNARPTQAVNGRLVREAM